MPFVNVCPCCEQPVPRTGLGLIVSLDANAASKDGKIIKLSPYQAEILHALARAGKRGVRRDAMYVAIYGHEAGPPEGSNSLNTQISKLRREVAKIGMKIVWNGTMWRLH